MKKNQEKLEKYVNYKWIEGFEGKYAINKQGDVLSVNYRMTGQAVHLKSARNKHGYMMITLTKDKKQKNYYIHRLTAEAFIPNPENYPEINHKDCNKLNNDISNLEQCSRQHNLEHSYKHNLAYNMPKKVTNGKKIQPSIKQAGRSLGIHFQAISACINGKTKSAGGYKQKIIEV